MQISSRYWIGNLWFPKVYIISIIYGAHWKSHECPTRNLSIPEVVPFGIWYLLVRLKAQAGSSMVIQSRKNMRTFECQERGVFRTTPPNQENTPHTNHNQLQNTSKENHAKQKNKRDNIRRISAIVSHVYICHHSYQTSCAQSCNNSTDPSS